MIAVDTNILVRYLIKDDRKQAETATEFLKNNSSCILKTVLLELAWVLSSQSGYNLSRPVVTERLRHLCGLPTITVEAASEAAQAISWYEQGLDFADALHLAASISLFRLCNHGSKNVCQSNSVSCWVQHRHPLKYGEAGAVKNPPISATKKGERPSLPFSFVPMLKDVTCPSLLSSRFRC